MSPFVVGIEETARRFGQYRAAELALFEVLGTWATSRPERDVSAMLATHAHRRAEHARWFAERIPDVAGFHAHPDGRSAVAAAASSADGPPPRLAALIQQARAAADTTELLRTVYDEVLAELSSTYERHLRLTDPRVDGPTARALTRALRDLADDRAEGLALLARRA